MKAKDLLEGVNTTIGTLRAKIIQNDAKRVRYGSNDPISGIIVLTYEPSGRIPVTAELFGPLKVAIMLTGISKIKMWRQLRNSYTYSRSEQELFSVTSTVYDEPFKSQRWATHQFPFVIYFPETMESSSTAGWDENVRFPTETALTLPPTFSDKPSGTQGRLESAIEYKLGVSANMPGLKIDVSKLSADSTPMVLYERPRMRQPSENTRHEISFGSVKGLGRGWPSTLTCEGPRNVYCGQPATFKLRLELQHPNTSLASSRPKFYLTAFGVKLRAATAVRGKRRLLSQPQMSVQNTVGTLICAVDSTNPFSESEDWTKRVATGKMPTVPSTFNSMNISRLYSIELDLILEHEGGSAEKLSRSYGVVVHPTLEPRNNSRTTVDALMGIADSRPSIGSVLPEYERPPEYETVSEG